MLKMKNKMSKRQALKGIMRVRDEAICTLAFHSCWYCRDGTDRDKKGTQTIGWFHLLLLRDKLSWNTWDSAVKPCVSLWEAEHTMLLVLGILAKLARVFLVFPQDRRKHAKSWEVIIVMSCLLVLNFCYSLYMFIVRYPTHTV